MSASELILASWTYFEVSALLAVAAGILFLLCQSIQRAWLPMRFRANLAIGQFLVVASVLLPLAMVSLPKQTLLRPSVQVWSGAVRKTSPGYALMSRASGGGSVGAVLSGWSIPERAARWALLLITAGAFIQGSLLLVRALRLKRSLRALPVIKTRGAVSIFASHEISSPFSFWLPGFCAVVLPVEFLTDPQDLMMAVRHELQHHRNGDTRWVFALEALKAAFFWNPAVGFLSRQISQIQEFACDEFLIGHRKLLPQAYGSCLARAAESAVHSRLALVGTTGMAGSSNGSTLKRRIAMLFKDRKSESRWTFALIVVGTLGLMASLAYASQSAIQDRRLTMNEARDYALKASAGTQVPIDMNDLVLAKLNRFVGTPEGRKWVRDAMTRMPNYRSMIDQKTAQYALPEELIAVAMFESGFLNDTISPPPYRARGLWQFIVSTARRYDLIVTDSVDERIDADKETTAAMQYFGDLFTEFQDWRLALKSYNEGEGHVAELIAKYGTRDPWVLERAESKESYLSGVIAMIIIFKNPSLLN